MSVIQKGQSDGSLAFIDSNDSRQVARFGGSNAGPSYGGSLIYRVPLVASDAAGGVVSVANPFGRAMWVGRVAIYVTTQSSGACTIDTGIAANGTTSNDTLIDGLSVAAAGIFNNITDIGTNGKSRQLLGATQFVTSSMATGATAGLVGFAYIELIDP